MIVWAYSVCDLLLQQHCCRAAPEVQNQSCKKTCCFQALQVSLTMSHRPLHYTEDWLKTHLGYLKIYSHNTGFIGNKYSEV